MWRRLGQKWRGLGWRSRRRRQSQGRGTASEKGEGRPSAHSWEAERRRGLQKGQSVFARKISCSCLYDSLGSSIDCLCR